jgi:trk system potassium uptake protein TrkA
MGKQVVVVGLGRFGLGVATTLHNLDHDVLAIDRNAEAVQEAASLATHAVQVEDFNEAALKKVGISNFDIGIVAMGSDMGNSIITTLLLKRLGVRYVIARAENNKHGEILEMIGADRVVYPEREMGERIGHEATLGDITGYVSAAPGHIVAKIQAKPNFVGMSLSELGISRLGRFGVSVLLIQRRKEAIITPQQDQIIEAEDVLFVYGNEDKLSEFMAKAISNGKTRL